MEYKTGLICVVPLASSVGCAIVKKPTTSRIVAKEYYILHGVADMSTNLSGMSQMRSTHGENVVLRMFSVRCLSRGFLDRFARGNAGCV